MSKGRRIVNHLKILIVFITTTILTAQEMVIVTTDTISKLLLVIFPLLDMLQNERMIAAAIAINTNVA